MGFFLWKKYYPHEKDNTEKILKANPLVCTLLNFFSLTISVRKPVSEMQFLYLQMWYSEEKEQTWAISPSCWIKR